MLIVLTGIDGSGKTTAAQAIVDAPGRTGTIALLLRNYAGRRWMSLPGLIRSLADDRRTTLPHRP